MHMINWICVLSIFCLTVACSSNSQPTDSPNPETVQVNLEEETEALPIKVGAEKIDEFIGELKGKNVALVVNQTSVIGSSHLVDSLLSRGISISMIFAPEHGFRGTADAGATIENEIDTKTGLMVRSLYGSNKKPKASDLAGVDIVIFDIQDVGARFYTYISTMHYVMESCAEQGVSFMVLDRPNPNGHYVDGPILDMDYQSFVGMHRIPIVHGLTVGELAQMINGEGWLSGGQTCNLTVITCDNYTHNDAYSLPIKPSPNLPNDQSIVLYPSLCFFEGTTISVGRGTDKQFQIFGHPSFEEASFTFTPSPKPGAMYPKLDGQECRGYDLSTSSEEFCGSQNELCLEFLLSAYNDYPDKGNFFLENKFIDKLAGTNQLRVDVIAGLSAEEIRAKWQPDLDAYKTMRKNYLLYPDFE